MNIIPINNHISAFVQPVTNAVSIEKITSIALASFAVLKTVMTNKILATSCVFTLALTSLAMIIAKITSFWITQNQQQIAKSRHLPVSFFKAEPPAFFQTLPCPSPTDVRDISPSIQMPVGFPFLPSNCGVVASIQCIFNQDELAQYVTESLKEIATNQVHQTNPFLEFTDEKGKPTLLSKELREKIEATLKDADGYFQTSVLILGLTKKVNPKTIYFGLTLSRAANLAIFYLEKWKGSSQNPPQILSAKEMQLLRLSLVRLIHHKHKSKILNSSHRQELMIPGLDFGLHPLHSNWIEPHEFMFQFLHALSLLHPQSAPFILEKVRSHVIYEAKGIQLGKKVRANNKIEQAPALRAQLNQPFVLKSFLQNYDKRIDSRGVYQSDSKKYVSRSLEIFLHEEIPYTNSKSHTHEQLSYSLNLKKSLFVQFEIFDQTSTKYPATSITLSDMKNLTETFEMFDGKRVNLVLESIIVHLGPNRQGAHYVTFLRKHSDCGQKIFFKCDDSSIGLCTKEDIRQILDGTYHDTVWGQASCHVASFSVHPA